MANKTVPTDASIDEFLASVSESRRQEAKRLIPIIEAISGEKSVLWGPSIIGVGSQHYKYESGREGDMPKLAFSPRKASLTVYFNEGFTRYGDHLLRLGKHKISASCLYITKLEDIDIAVLQEMLELSYKLGIDQ